MFTQDRTIGLPGRREFFAKLAHLVAGTAAAEGLLLLISSDAQSIPRDDPRLHMGWIHYPAGTGKVRAYLAGLREEKKRPAVTVIRENKGLHPHIRDVTRHMALEEFLAVAPDALLLLHTRSLPEILVSSRRKSTMASIT